MSTILNEAFGHLIQAVEKGLFFLPPAPNGLGAFRPNLSQLAAHRDANGLLGQLQADQVNLDFGDSAQKTGVAAFCNSALDQSVLHHFETAGIMVRYPYAEPANNWKNCSRDQLLGFAAGCWRGAHHQVVERLLDQHLHRLVLGIPTCQNTENDFPGTQKDPPVGDLLMLHDVMFLRVCSGQADAYYDGPGQLSLLLAITVTSAAIDHEYTQLLLEAIVCGKLDYFVLVHPEYQANLRHYWGKRDQIQIAEALVYVCERELMRYKNQFPLALLFPVHLIEALLAIDWSRELFSLDSLVKMDWATQLASAMAADAYQHAQALYQLTMALLNLTGKAMDWIGEAVDVFSQFIKEGIELAADFLMNILELGKTNLTEVFERFTREIVAQLSLKMKAIIIEAFYENNYLLLKARVSAFEQQYRDYLKTKDAGQLDFLNQTAYDIIALAELMGVPALGIYCLMRFLQVAVYRQKAKTDPDYLELIAAKILQGKAHVENLLEQSYLKIDQAFSYTSHLLPKSKDPAEPRYNRFKISFDGGEIQHVEFPVEKPIGELFDTFYRELKTRKKEAFYKAVFQPAVGIMANMEMAQLDGKG